MPEPNAEHMSIQAGLYGLCYYIYHNGVELFEEITYDAPSPEALTGILDGIFEEKLAGYRPSRVVLLHHNALYTLIPSALYDPDRARTLLSLAIDLLPSDTVEADENLPFDTVNVYVPFENVNNFFIDRYGQIEYYHSASAFLRYLSTRAGTEDSRIFVRFAPKDFQLAAVRNGQLLLLNTFPYHHLDDFLYYFFFAWEQLQLPSGQTKITLGGQMQTATRAAEALSDFTENIQIDAAAEKEILKSWL